MEKFLIISLIGLVTVLWLWAVIDIFRSKFKNQAKTLFCLMGVLFFPILGPIVYFQFRKNLRSKSNRKFSPSFKQLDEN